MDTPGGLTPAALHAARDVARPTVSIPARDDTGAVA